MHLGKFATRLALVGVILVSSACAPVEITPPTVTETAPYEPSRTFAPTPPPDPVPAIAFPLTGLDAAEVAPELLARPVVSVKIENTDQSRPQRNIEFYDTMYEEYVESGISRFIAQFHSNYPTDVGPIRSMRPMDWNIMGSYPGPLVFSGAQSIFINQARNTGQELMAEDLGSRGFFRVKGKPAPHNLHGDIEKFAANAREYPAPHAPYAFAYPAAGATATTSGTATSMIQIDQSGFAKPRWHWDEGSGTWLRFEKEEPHVTQAGVQLSAANVIILYVQTRMNSGVPESLVIRNDGKGHVATGGKYLPLTWSKASQVDDFKLFGPDGNPVLLAPGQTWIHILPDPNNYGTAVKFHE